MNIGVRKTLANCNELSLSSFLISHVAKFKNHNHLFGHHMQCKMISGWCVNWSSTPSNDGFGHVPRLISTVCPIFICQGDISSCLLQLLLSAEYFHLKDHLDQADLACLRTSESTYVMLPPRFCPILFTGNQYLEFFDINLGG